MKIALAQTKPVRGDISANIAGHVRFLAYASSRGVAMLVFPELSLTGYEPHLARELASDLRDPCLDAFQHFSDQHGIRIAVGLPIHAIPRPYITLALFAPNSLRSSYSKRYLHPEEEAYFSPAPRVGGIWEAVPKIALSICYELSVPAHAEAAFNEGAELYLCSVAKTQKGVASAHLRLTEIARRNAAPVLMVNCVGASGDGVCAGASAAWNRRGELLGQLDGVNEGLLVYDTATEQIAVYTT